MGQIRFNGDMAAITFTKDEIWQIRINRIQGRDDVFNYYGTTLMGETLVPIPREWYMDILDEMKDGRLCLVEVSYFRDPELNYL